MELFLYRVLRHTLDKSFHPSSENLTLWIGQRNQNQFLFKVNFLNIYENITVFHFFVVILGL